MKYVYVLAVVFTLVSSSKCHGSEVIHDYLRLGTSSTQEGQLGTTPGIWVGFSWSDPPWGAWNLQAQLDKGGHVERSAFELSWEWRKKLGKKYQLLINLGLITFLQNFNDENIKIKQESLRSLISLGINREMRANIFIGLRVIAYSRTLHNFREIDLEQERLSRIVTDLDQSWLISAQLGLSYLFD